MDKSLKKDEKAVSPVLGAILILAIGVTVLTTVQINFVPVWNAQEELDHIQQMFDDFKELKSGIDSAVQSGTTLSVPIIMGFKYSPKTLVINPKESAFASLEIKENTWAEIRYNEMFPDGMTDETSIKNITTSTITYTLMGSQKYNSFIYEHGMIRRSGSNYTSSSQVAITNGNIYLLSVKPLVPETTSGIEMRTVNIYPTSQQKNSVIGKNVWIILHTKPEYVNWWNDSIRNGGSDVKLANNTTGIVIAYINTAVIKMGEAYLLTSPRAAPEHAPPYRIVKITPDNTYLPLDGITTLVVEVQDKYNNPVPNWRVNFSLNKYRRPANSNANAQLLQDSAISATDGRASVDLKTGGAGFYYIDASVLGSSATFVYPVSSQGGVLSLSQTGSGPGFIITATLKDSFGTPQGSKQIIFDRNDGNLSDLKQNTTSNGNASTTLNVNNAVGISITNIQARNIITNSVTITWDTPNNITVSAQSGYIFNSIIVPTMVNTTGCVQYGISSGIYSSTLCDSSGSVSFHSVNLPGLLPSTAYYFKVNSSRGAVNVDSTEYMFVMSPGLPDMTPDTHNYTYVTGNTMSNGTISNWLYMRNASDGGAFATLTEGGAVSGAETSNAIPALKGASDNTNDVLADIQANDISGSSPSSVFLNDGWYTVDRNRIMFIDGFNNSGMSGSVSDVKLRVKYSVENGYRGDNQIRWSRDGGALNTTGIQPANEDQNVIRSYDLGAQGFNNLAQISTLNIEFSNNDGGDSSDSVSFDYVWIQVTYSGNTTYALNITTNTTLVPVDTNYYLEMNYSLDNNDTYKVYVFNGTNWNNRGSLTFVPWSLFNISLSNQEYNGGTSYIRYIDNNASGTTQGNLKIDYQRIHGYTHGN